MFEQDLSLIPDKISYYFLQILSLNIYNYLVNFVGFPRFLLSMISPVSIFSVITSYTVRLETFNIFFIF